MFELMEPINVWVFFKKDNIQPFMFFWQGRQIKVDQVNLIHKSQEGSTIYHHFSISSSGNFYRLRFDSLKLKWFIEAVEEDI